jgi:hypothetical protein
MEPRVEQVYGAPCYLVANDTVSLVVTKAGAQMAPVVFFYHEGNPVQPYYISPWQGEEPTQSELSGLLKTLRGDFFCMPFGDNSAGKKNYSPHGATAAMEWTASQKTHDDITTLQLEIDLPKNEGHVERSLSLAEGESTVYVREKISGVKGPMPLGHHATLGTHNGELAIRTSPIKFGYTAPYSVQYTQGGEYYSLAPLTRFSSLREVPTIWKQPEVTDCSVFPAREGFVDILQVFQEQTETPGWVTAVCRDGGYLWFSLKDISVKPSTVFWMENRGRHQSPWNGRNQCIGLEDVCAYFAEGYEDSVNSNILNTHEDVKTFHQLDGSEFALSYIEGVLRIPENFDAVDHVVFGEGGVTFHAESRAEVSAPIRWKYVFGEEL